MAETKTGGSIHVVVELSTALDGAAGSASQSFDGGVEAHALSKRLDVAASGPTLRRTLINFALK